MIVLGISLVTLAYSLYVIIGSFSQYKESAEKYETLVEIYDASEEEIAEEGKTKQNDNHSELQQINEDYVGWITIEGTTINYPVVKGTDNSFYLTHNFYQESDFVGAIFMDYRNTGHDLDKHMIIYGHNMKDNSMFGDLKNFTQKDFYENHKIISLDFIDDTYKWEIFSIYIENEASLLETEFTSKEAFDEYVLRMKDQSIIGIPSVIEQDDTVLTLSTCTNENDDERVIVHAKLINREGKTGNET